jgi:hypothetical protein
MSVILINVLVDNTADHVIVDILHGILSIHYSILQTYAFYYDLFKFLCVNAEFFIQNVKLKCYNTYVYISFVTNGSGPAALRHQA